MYCYTTVLTPNRIERFSLECHKTQNKVITLANHKKDSHSNEPIRIEYKYMQPAQSAGKRLQASHDKACFGFTIKLC